MFPNVKEQQQAGGIFQYKLLLPPKAVRQLRALAEVAAEEAARVAADEAVAATEAEAARVAAVAQMEVRRLARLEKRPVVGRRERTGYTKHEVLPSFQQVSR